jgi:hypothetical protein
MAGRCAGGWWPNAFDFAVPLQSRDDVVGALTTWRQRVASPRHHHKPPRSARLSMIEADRQWVIVGSQVEESHALDASDCDGSSYHASLFVAEPMGSPAASWIVAGRPTSIHTIPDRCSEA